MKKLFNTSLSSDRLQIALFLFRVVIGCGMLTHGLPKMEKLLAGDFSFADPIGIGVKLSLILTVLTEVVFSIFLIAGFLSKIATFCLAFTLGVAAFIIHSGDVFSAKETAVLYFAAFVFLLITGPGKYSLDYLISKVFKK